MTIDILSNTPVVIDFETYAIEDGSPTPPIPVGVSIQYPNQPPKYYAWKHRENNNCTFEDAKSVILEAWMYKDGICFHNAGFDVSIAEYYFDAPRLPASAYHDTKILAFLLRPDDAAHGLKDLAADILEMPPEERDTVAEWLESNAKALGIKIPRSKKSDDYFMKHIPLVPGDIIGKYAEGDTIRTQLLWQKFFPRVWFDEESKLRKNELWNYSGILTVAEQEELSILTKREKFYGAYLRELEASLILAEMRYIGMRVNVQDLNRDINLVEAELSKIDAWFKAFFQGRDVNLSAPAQVINALLDMHIIQREDVPKTEKGKLSGSASALNALLPNSLFSALYAYNMKLNKYLGTFMKPWYKQATNSESNGRVFTSWVSVKTETDGASAGTRTGRISSQPNLQNIPRVDKQRFFKDEEHPDKPEYPFDGAPILPNIRGYVIPYYSDHTFIDADYSQQELRVLAHFEDDKMLTAFKADRNLDIHKYVADLISQVSKQEIKRTPAKTINFTIVYGGGIKKLAEKLTTSPEHAATLRMNYFKAFPRIQILNDKLKKAAYRGEPFYTLGGRRYYAIKEKGEYKTHLMLNTLVQGSSADMSKQALIDFYKIKDHRTIIILTVHDEFLVSTPLTIAKEEAEKLVYCMEKQYCDAPLIADCIYGRNTWAECKAA